MLVKDWHKLKKTNFKSTRDGFGDGLLAAAKTDKAIVVVSADLAGVLRRLDVSLHELPGHFWLLS